MVVRTLDRNPGNSGLIGLHIGAMNVQRYFPRDSDIVELELDHLRIVCSLQPAFWQDKPEIHDMRLSSWLESKRFSGKLASKAAPVALIPNGIRSFRLQILAKEESEAVISGFQDVALPAANKGAAVAPFPMAGQGTTPTVVADRRRRSIEFDPERRKKVARLNSDEFASSAAAN